MCSNVLGPARYVCSSRVQPGSCPLLPSLVPCQPQPPPPPPPPPCRPLGHSALQQLPSARLLQQHHCSALYHQPDCSLGQARRKPLLLQALPSSNPPPPPPPQCPSNSLFFLPAVGYQNWQLFQLLAPTGASFVWLNLPPSAPRGPTDSL